MSLRLLIDEDSQAKLLITLLKQAGHNVITVNEKSLSGQPDEIVFDYAQREQRLILTRNYDDFQTLHHANSKHSGILVICENQNTFYSKHSNGLLPKREFGYALPYLISVISHLCHIWVRGQ